MAKWLRRRIANPLFPGSNPGAASYARLAQWLERLLDMQEVAGSSPAPGMGVF